MSRFVRNLLLGLGAIYLIAQFAEAYGTAPVHAALGVNPEFHPLAFVWQWFTASFVERPGDVSLIGAALAIYLGALLYPQVEARYDARTLVTAIASAVAGAGILATLVAFVRPAPFAISSMSTPIQGLIAFELWNRRGSSMHFAFFPGTRPFELSAKEIGGVLLGFVLIHFFLVPYLASLAFDLGALLGGWLYAYLRERRSAKKFVRHSFTVLKGGKSDRMLH